MLEMRQALSLLALGLSLSAGAQAGDATKFSCGNVGGIREWKIYVDLDRKVAGFFDGVTTSVVPLKEITFLQARSLQEIFVFEGSDTGGMAGERIQISFNQTRLRGSVTFHMGKQREESRRASDFCKADRDFEIDLDEWVGVPSNL